MAIDDKFVTANISDETVSNINRPRRKKIKRGLRPDTFVGTVDSGPKPWSYNQQDVNLLSKIENVGIRFCSKTSKGLQFLSSQEVLELLSKKID